MVMLVELVEDQVAVAQVVRQVEEAV